MTNESVSKANLIESLACGCKEESLWRIGTEHEKFIYDINNMERIPYNGENGIKSLLNLLMKHGDTAIMEADNIIGIKLEEGGSVSLEPAGQLELSGMPLTNLHETCHEITNHLNACKLACDKLGLAMLGMGYDPFTATANVPWMPKQRYSIMRQEFPKQGEYGVSMMVNTCTIQVNLDFSSEADMVNKMRVATKLQPLASALFVNSPYANKNHKGYLSNRLLCWQKTDAYRAGVPMLVFEENFGFERWVDYVLDAPMMFVQRDGNYLDVCGANFRDYILGKEDHPELAGCKASFDDWNLHSTSVFPDVRLKSFIEMRGADGGPREAICALPAFWVGLLYDASSLNQISSICQEWPSEAIPKLTKDTATAGLSAKIAGRSLWEWGNEILKISQQGLINRKQLNAKGQDESMYLDVLNALIANKTTFAQQKLMAFKGDISNDTISFIKKYGF